MPGAINAVSELLAQRPTFSGLKMVLNLIPAALVGQISALITVHPEIFGGVRTPVVYREERRISGKVGREMLPFSFIPGLAGNTQQKIS